MRTKLSELAFLPLAALLIGTLSAPAVAGSVRDRIYADSFGNLIVLSPAGYKRIVVGAGHLAKDLAAYERSSVQPDEEFYLEGDESGATLLRECWKPAVLLKGRSYMYGLADGEIPDLPGKWCD